jgi:Flp pilus assembly protein TadG
MVEFALVIPIFLLVLSGILDFGFALFSRMTVISAAREGARAAIMVPDDPTYGYQQISSTAQARAVAAAAQGVLTITTSNVQVSCLETTVSTTSPPACNWNLYTTANTTGAQPGDSVSVTVTYTYHTFFPLLFGTTFNLSSTVQMVIE